MVNIKNAIIQFKKDTSYFPNEGPFQHNLDGGSVHNSPDQTEPGRVENAWLASPANFVQLIVEPKDADGDSVMEWNIDTQRGWRGPYLSTNLAQVLTISANIDRDHINNPNPPAVLSKVIAISDKFLFPAKKNTKHDNTKANLNFYQVSLDENGDPKFSPINSGRPYLFIREEGKDRIISAGPNGKYYDEDDIVVYIHTSQ